MPFTTKEFPNKIFEDFDEYNAYLELRKKIISELKSRKRNKKTRVVKVASTLRKDNPILLALNQWILRYLQM